MLLELYLEVNDDAEVGLMRSWISRQTNTKIVKVDPLCLSNESNQELRDRMVQQHEAGTCKPCLWWYTAHGCAIADTCQLCHQPHNMQNRSRPSKAKRNIVKQQSEKALEKQCSTQASKTALDQQDAKHRTSSDKPSLSYSAPTRVSL
eukprot:gnl/TRDRNA2_/TRDRNA2_176507_c2_seq11.p1 gnl/TRDRNA2_/TRDRNA2_176507_c2~~gnl/TRDRNA2_/TRDRNA2_176507_c2_seq11.p1  ORF type:complete len:148 (+),score=15.35 gnl/TRDRNA2_/TRDRNA2_176507_c2_seq11:88-531(+)